MSQIKHYTGNSRGHAVQMVEAEGGEIVLEDDSRWQVYEGFVGKTKKWQANEMITVTKNRDILFPYRLVNVHKNESVEARLL
ncbi:MAG: hypothetical protein ACC641_07085 [Acidiferrobacterales bacterium]